MTDLKWTFGKRGLDGENQGADPSLHSISDIDTERFVREAIQNSNDAINDYDEEDGEIVFSVTTIENTDEEKSFDKFADRVDLEGLARHIKGQADTTAGKRTKPYLEKIRDEEKIRVLKIEDRGATGLTGPERSDPGEGSKFADLVRNVETTTKATGTGTKSPGGSNGVGKLVYWAFSGLSTALFYTDPINTGEGEWDPKLIGRSKISNPEVEGETRKASGYFGVREEKKRGIRGNAYRGENIADKAEELHVGRKKGRKGTSISILGFNDPANEDERDNAKLLSDIRDAAAKNFWPTMIADELEVYTQEAEKETDLVEAEDNDDLEHFIDCYRAYLENNTKDTLESEGDIVKKAIEIEIPKRRDGVSTPHSAEMDLVVKQVEEESNKLQGHVAMFRGPGMVIRYRDLSRLTGAKPFYAILVAGEAKTLSEANEEDKALDRLLKMAEPTEHHKWDTTQNLKSEYLKGTPNRTGFGVVNDIDQKVKEALRKVVTPEIKETRNGADSLGRRFLMDGSNIKDRESRPIHFEGGDKYREDGKYVRKRTARIEDEFGEEFDRWEVRIELVSLGEDGSSSENLPVSKIECDNADEIEKDGEDKILVFSPNKRSTEFTVKSKNYSQEELNEHGEVRFKFTGGVVKND